MERFPELTGRVALITGASQGLGRFFAVDLAKQGMKVALLARNRRDLEDAAFGIRRWPGTAFVVAADVTDRHAIDEGIVAVEAALGPIDVVVNAAGSIMPP